MVKAAWIFCQLQLDDNGAAFHVAADLAMYGRDLAGPWCANTDFHFHAFQHHQYLALLDRVADLCLHRQNLTHQGCLNRAAKCAGGCLTGAVQIGHERGPQIVAAIIQGNPIIALPGADLAAAPIRRDQKGFLAQSLYLEAVVIAIDADQHHAIAITRPEADVENIVIDPRLYDRRHRHGRGAVA